MLHSLVCETATLCLLSYAVFNHIIVYQYSLDFHQIFRSHGFGPSHHCLFVRVDRKNDNYHSTFFVRMKPNATFVLAAVVRLIYTRSNFSIKWSFRENCKKVYHSLSRSRRGSVCTFRFLLVTCRRWLLVLDLFNINTFWFRPFFVSWIFFCVLAENRNWGSLHHIFYTFWIFFDSVELCFLAQWKIKAAWAFFKNFWVRVQYSVPTDQLVSYNIVSCSLGSTVFTGFFFIPDYGRNFSINNSTQ